MASRFSILFIRSLPIFLAFLFPSPGYAADDSTFALYAYGSGIGGAPVVYRNCKCLLSTIRNYLLTCSL
jgi:hypothetical protein